MAIRTTKVANEVWVKNPNRVLTTKVANEVWQRLPLQQQHIRVTKVANEVWTGVTPATGVTAHLGQVAVIGMRHEGGNLYLRVNNGPEVAATSGNTSDLTGALKLAMSAVGLKANYKFFESAIFNQVPVDGVRFALEKNLYDWLMGGVTPPSSPPSGSWLPTQLSNLLVWYPADRYTGSNGTPLLTMTDYSGNGWHATQPGVANRATLAVAVQNGLNGLRFDTAGGANDLTYPMYTGSPGPDTNPYYGKAQGAVFIVFKRDVQPPVNAHESGLWVLGTGGVTDHWPYVDNQIYDGFGSDTRKSTGLTAPDFRSYRIVGVHSAPSDYGIYVDGASFYATTSNTVSFQNFPQIGGSSFSGASLQGYMLEAIFLDAKPSVSDRQKTEGYLFWKWGLQAQIPVGHPYVGGPP